MKHIEFYLPNPFVFRTFQVQKIQQYFTDYGKITYELTLLNGDMESVEFYLSDLKNLVVNVY